MLTPFFYTTSLSPKISKRHVRIPIIILDDNFLIQPKTISKHHPKNVNTPPQGGYNESADHSDNLLINMLTYNYFYLLKRRNYMIKKLIPKKGK